MDTQILNKRSCISSSKECVQILSDNNANDKLLSRIANHLIINTSFLNNLGLYHGKMGVAIFFAHYALYTTNSLYDDFASELMDEIYEEIHEGQPIDLENGLCGIAWGILYLVQKGFIKGDINEILEDIDKKIMERDLRRTTDLSFKKGLKGIYYYVNSRLDFSSHDITKIPFDFIYISELKKAAKKLENDKSTHLLSSIFEAKTICEEDITKWRLGLSDGCAGYGLKLMMV